jgi:hypothetical protein
MKTLTATPVNPEVNLGTLKILHGQLREYRVAVARASGILLYLRTLTEKLSV